MSNFNDKEQYNKDQYEIEEESNSSRKWDEDIGDDDINNENTTFVLEEEPESHVIEVGNVAKKPISKMSKIVMGIGVSALAIAGAATWLLPNIQTSSESTENTSNKNKDLNLEDGQVEEQKQENTQTQQEQEVVNSEKTTQVAQVESEESKDDLTFKEQKVAQMEEQQTSQTTNVGSNEKNEQAEVKENLMEEQKPVVEEEKQPSILEQAKEKLEETKDKIVETKDQIVETTQNAVQEVKEKVSEQIEAIKTNKEEITPFVEQKVLVEEDSKALRAIEVVSDKVKIVHGNTLDNRRIILEMQKEIDLLKNHIKDLEVKQSETLPCSCTNESVKDKVNADKVPAIVKDKAPVKNTVKPKEKKGNFVQLVGKRKTPELKDMSSGNGGLITQTSNSGATTLTEKHEVRIQSILNGIVWVNDSTGRTHTYTVGDKLGGRVIGNIDENSGVFDVNGKKILDLR